MIITLLTQGGSNETEIATPTNEAWFPDRIEMATAAPDGTATSVPTHTTRGSPRLYISVVGHIIFWSGKLLVHS